MSVADTQQQSLPATQQEAAKKGPVIEMPEHIWSLLGDTLEEYQYHQTDFFHQWLQLHFVNNTAVVQAVLILKNQEKNSYQPVAKWPLKSKVSRFAKVSHKVLEKKRGLLTPIDDGSGHMAAAYPIFVNGDLFGVVGIALNSNTQADINRIMFQLQWSQGWLERLINRIQLRREAHVRQQLESSMRLLAVVQSEQDFARACMAFVTELATELHCDRVSLGFPKGKHVVVQSLSHSAQIEKRMNLIRAIGLAMEEAIIFGKAIRYPPQKGDEMIFADHQALADQYACGSILTLPVYANDTYYCVITFERSSKITGSAKAMDNNYGGKLSQGFSQEDIDYCRSIAVLSAPSLEEKRLNHRSIWRKMGSALMEQCRHFIGPRYVWQKILVASLLAIIIFFAFAKGEYRVSTDSVLEGSIQRVIVAPFAGYIKTVGPKAGDIVDERQLLVGLDDKDLRLERLGYVTEAQQYQKEYQDAFAKRDRVAGNIAKAQLAQVEAKLALVDAKLRRANITAPFAGIIISGDLSQRVGGFVDRGEELFKLAPLDDYRLLLYVDEHRIGDLMVGQSGQLVLAALPYQSFAFEIVNITSETTAKDGKNTFRVEAQLLEKSPVLRPGMEGVAKVSIGERHLIDIWTRSLRDWMRLFIWKWLP